MLDLLQENIITHVQYNYQNTIKNNKKQGIITRHHVEMLILCRIEIIVLCFIKTRNSNDK